MDNNFDTLKLFVKKEQFANIISNYQLLGWKLESQTDNARYEDIVDVVLLRPHKIENKDDLQLLQIYVEENLNAQAKLKRNKHIKSLLLNLILGLIGLGGVTLGILALVNVMPVLGLVGGIMLIVAGVLCWGVQAVLVFKLLKHENTTFNQKQEQLEQQLKHLQKKANDFWVGDYE